MGAEKALALFGLPDRTVQLCGACVACWAVEGSQMCKVCLKCFKALGASAKLATSHAIPFGLTGIILAEVGLAFLPLSFPVILLKMMAFGWEADYSAAILTLVKALIHAWSLSQPLMLPETT